jgi:hypothetical protein
MKIANILSILLVAISTSYAFANTDFNTEAPSAYQSNESYEVAYCSNQDGERRCNSTEVTCKSACGYNPDYTVQLRCYQSCEQQFNACMLSIGC